MPERHEFEDFFISVIYKERKDYFIQPRQLPTQVPIQADHPQYAVQVVLQPPLHVLSQNVLQVL